MILCTMAILSVPIAAAYPELGKWLLFCSPALAGVSGSTIRLVLNFWRNTAPLNRQSALTTAALGLTAGGIAGLLFVTAQAYTLTEPVSGEQAGRLVPFGVIVGFIGGLTLDVVFRKLITSDVVDLGGLEGKRRA